MLIYDGNSSTPFDRIPAYKSAHKRKRVSIRTKALKRGRQTKKLHSTSKKKVQKSKQSKKRRTIKNKPLNEKNKKFLKSLGFRVKKTIKNG